MGRFEPEFRNHRARFGEGFSIFSREGFRRGSRLSRTEGREVVVQRGCYRTRAPARVSLLRRVHLLRGCRLRNRDSAERRRRDGEHKNADTFKHYTSSLLWSPCVVAAVQQIFGIGPIPAPWKAFFFVRRFDDPGFITEFVGRGRVAVVHLPELECDASAVLVLAFVDVDVCAWSFGTTVVEGVFAVAIEGVFGLCEGRYNDGETHQSEEHRERQPNAVAPLRETLLHESPFVGSPMTDVFRNVLAWVTMDRDSRSNCVLRYRC